MTTIYMYVEYFTKAFIELVNVTVFSFARTNLDGKIYSHVNKFTLSFIKNAMHRHAHG